MDHNELSEQKNKVAKELASINVLVSEGKAILLKMKDEKEAFVRGREKEIADRIQKLVEDSQNLFEEVKSNYTRVHEFHEILESFSKYLVEAHAEFKQCLQDFDTASEAEKKAIDEARAEIALMKRDIKIDQGVIEREKKAISNAKESIKRDRLKLADDQAVVTRAINRLKENRI